MHTTYDANDIVCETLAYMVGQAQKFGALVLVVLAQACVHASVERTGRMRLGDGAEGMVPVLASVPADSEEVAMLTVEAEGLATAERLTKHLARKGSLLGCTAVVAPTFHEDRAQARCVRTREGVVAAAKAVLVAEPSAALLARAVEAGDEGAALLSVLAQVKAQKGDARAWPLRWYLSTYPESRFAADVEALFVSPTATASTAGAGPSFAQPMIRTAASR